MSIFDQKHHSKGYVHTEARGGGAPHAAAHDAKIRSMDANEHLTNPSGGSSIDAGSAKMKVPQPKPTEKSHASGANKLRTPKIGG